MSTVIGHQRKLFLRICLIASAIFFVYFTWTSRMNELDPQKKTYSDKNALCPCMDNETRHVYEFCYTTTSNGTNVTGTKFSCEWLPYLKRLNLLNPNYSDKPAMTGQVIATGASYDHFAEVIDHIGTLIRFFSSQNNTRILFYDFGLTDNQAAALKNACHIEYRQFNFNKYPHSVRNLINYRWKFLLFAELMQEFDAVWWADSSIRWLTSNLSQVYEAVNQRVISPFLLVDGQGHSVLATTHPGMFKYLPIDMKKIHLKEMYAGGFLFVARSKVSAQIMKWAVLCSLESMCMEPPGAKLAPCNWFGGNEYWHHYADCHRYDQSMINIIMNSYWNYDTNFYSTKLIPKFASINRKSTGQYQLKQLCN